MTRPAARLVDLAFAHARDGAGEAVVGVGERLTYSQLAKRVERTARALARAGLQPGARVAFLGSPGPAFLISQLATHLAGGVWLGLNPRYTFAELQHPLEDAEPALVVIDIDHDASVIEAIAGELDRGPRIQCLHRLDDLANVPNGLAPPHTALSPEIALIVYTSGTTGVPKGAMLTHSGMVEAARLYRQRYDHPNMRTLLNLPINHVGGLVDITATVIASGGTLVAQKQFDPKQVPALLREERVSLLGQVPAMHLAIEASAPFDAGDFQNLRHLVWSGAAMPRSWIERHIMGPAELSTCYGQTECSGACTFTSPGASVEELADTVGRPASDNLIRIEAADGEPGEILICGPLLMAGYLNKAAATQETIQAGWLRTGDLGQFDKDGNLRLIGRSREMYKSGGYNIYPREIEIALEAHPAVAAAAVIGLPDPQWGEIGWAFVLARDPVEPSGLDAFSRERLANFKIPKRIVVANELPMLPIGKIDKRALRLAAEGGVYG